MHYVQELIHENFDLKMKFCELIKIRKNDFANIVFFWWNWFRALWECQRHLNSSLKLCNYMQLYNLFKKQLCVFFTLIDSFHYSMHKSTEVQLPKNE